MANSDLLVKPTQKIDVDGIKDYLGITDEELSRTEQVQQALADAEAELDDEGMGEFEGILDELGEAGGAASGVDRFIEGVKDQANNLKKVGMLTKDLSKAMVKDSLKKVKDMMKEDGKLSPEQEEKIEDTLKIVKKEEEAVQELRKKLGDDNLGKVNTDVSTAEAPEISKTKTHVKKTKVEKAEEKPMETTAEDIEKMELNVKDSFIDYPHRSEDKGRITYCDVRNFTRGDELLKVSDAKKTQRWEEASVISKKLVKEIRDLKAHNVEKKTTGLKRGKINRRQLYRQDRQVFMRNDSPQREEADLSVYLALDHSGSTCGGLDIQIGTIGLAITDAMEKLHIPHHVLMYDGYIAPITGGNRRSTSKWILAGPTSGQGMNDERAVMEHVAWEAENDRHKHKMLIIVTDGDGSGETTGLRNLKAKVPDMNVIVIGLNYDGGSFNLSRAKNIYGEQNAIVVKSRKEFANSLARVIRKEVLAHD